MFILSFPAVTSVVDGPHPRVKEATLQLWALMYHETYTMKSPQAVLELHVLQS